MTSRLYDNATCIGCGYCLHGLEEPRCPECGRAFDSGDWRTFDHGQRLPRRWLMIAVVPTAIGSAAMIAFRVALAIYGLQVTQLWLGGKPLTGAAVQGAAEFADIGRRLSSWLLLLMTLALCYSVGLIIVACGRGDRKTAALAALLSIICMFTGLHAVKLGFIIAGI